MLRSLPCFRLLWLLLICSSPLARAQNVPEAKVLTTIAQIRALPAEEAAKAFPVRLRGVITYHEPGRKKTFIQDETGGIYILIDPASGREPPGLEPGALVEIEGRTHPGAFASHVRGPTGGTVRIHRLGSAEFPSPQKGGIGGLLQPGLHCQFIEVYGMVREQRIEPGRLILEVVTEETVFEAIIPGPWTEENLPKHLLLREIRLRGVHLAEFNDRRQLTGFHLMVPGMEQIWVPRKNRSEVFSRPVRSIGHLLRFTMEQSQRVRIAGVVTLALPGEGAFIADDTGSVWVGTNQRIALSKGDHVEAVGFSAAGTHRPILSQAVFRKTGETSRTSAREVG